MAASGAVLFGFVISHLVGNLQIFLGQEAINRYSHFLKSTPEFLWLARMFLLLMLIAPPLPAQEKPFAPVVFQDATSVAFLDHRPLFPGHTLLIPKQHYETLADLPASLLQPYFAGAQLLARAVELALQADGTFVGINNRVSQSVPHLHIHIVPRRKGDGLRGFFWPRQKYNNEDEMRRAQEAIRAHVR